MVCSDVDDDHQKEILVSTEDYYIRCYKDKDNVFEIKESS